MSEEIGTQQLMKAEETIKHEGQFDDCQAKNEHPHPSEMNVPLLILFGYQFNGDKNVR
jgi:hypothetical protein